MLTWAERLVFMRFRASQIAEVTGGQLIGDDVLIDGATQDSREVKPGCLFVPLAAGRDGHDFISDAMARGAGAHLTSAENGPGTAIRVSDTSTALADLGAAARCSIGSPVVGITGSVGKTSVKDMTAAVLDSLGTVHASRRSFNNQIGVPLTLLESPPDPTFVVVELGARAEGDIKALCDLARPDIGVVTTVGVAHTEAFGSIDAIVRTKGELLDGLPAHGCAVLNADMSEVLELASRSRAPVLSFGDRGEVRAREVTLDDDLRASFRLESPWGRAQVRLTARGAHMVPNALAAAAVGLFLGVSPDAAAAGLTEAELSPWRMEVTLAPSGVVVINDAYNANPESMTAALDALVLVPGEGRRVAVLGMMAELGDWSDNQHSRIAAYAETLGIEVIPMGTDLYGAGATHDMEVAWDAYKDLNLRTGDAVLVKGSRVVGLEEFARKVLEG